MSAKQIIEATQDAADQLSEKLEIVSAYVNTDNFKFLPREKRAELFDEMLRLAGEVEDNVKALIKTLRAVKRERLREGDQADDLIAFATSRNYSVTPKPPVPFNIIDDTREVS